MTPRSTLVAMLIALAGAGAAQAPQKIAELEGRAAGKPQRCLPLPPGRLFNTSDSDPHLLLYDDGKTVWASRLATDCRFGPGESIIPDTSASYYCQGDFVRQGNRIELSPFGARCALGKFTPWRTAK